MHTIGNFVILKKILKLFFSFAKTNKLHFILKACPHLSYKWSNLTLHKVKFLAEHIDGIRGVK